MTENTSPAAAREALRRVDAAPRPSTQVPRIALVLASAAWAPGFLANAWAVKHGGIRTDWWVTGLACTAVLVCVSLVMVACQVRVARGWRQAPLLGLGISGLIVGFGTVLVQRSDLNGWLVVAIAILGVLGGCAGGHALAEAPDDLGLSQ